MQEERATAELYRRDGEIRLGEMIGSCRSRSLVEQFCEFLRRRRKRAEEVQEKESCDSFVLLLLLLLFGWVLGNNEK